MTAAELIKCLKEAHPNLNREVIIVSGIDCPGSTILSVYPERNQLYIDIQKEK